LPPPASPTRRPAPGLPGLWQSWPEPDSRLQSCGPFIFRITVTHEERSFFFEKKKQKTFICLGFGYLRIGPATMVNGFTLWQLQAIPPMRYRKYPNPDSNFQSHLKKYNG
jgi:hypothetical protein